MPIVLLLENLVLEWSLELSPVSITHTEHQLALLKLNTNGWPFTTHLREAPQWKSETKQTNSNLTIKTTQQEERIGGNREIAEHFKRNTVSAQATLKCNLAISSKLKDEATVSQQLQNFISEKYLPPSLGEVRRLLRASLFVSKTPGYSLIVQQKENG